MTSKELSEAQSCHLIEKDGSRWEVLDVEFDGARVWITARPASRGPVVGDTPREAGGDALRIFDTVLRHGAELEWRFPNGRTLRARLEDDSGSIHWQRHVDPPPHSPFHRALFA